MIVFLRLRSGEHLLADLERPRLDTRDGLVYTGRMSPDPGPRFFQWGWSDPADLEGATRLAREELPEKLRFYFPQEKDYFDTRLREYLESPNDIVKRIEDRRCHP